MTDAQNKVYDSIAKSILGLSSSRPCLIAISGKDASGKTMLANMLAEYLESLTDRQIIRISADDFMNERSVRRTITGSEGESCYRYTFNFDALKKLHSNHFSWVVAMFIKQKFLISRLIVKLYLTTKKLGKMQLLLSMAYFFLEKIWLVIGA